MHMVEGKELQKRRQERDKKHKTNKRRRVALPAVLIVLVLYVTSSLLAPVATLKTSSAQISLPSAQVVSMPWPVYGQAAIGAVGYGMLARNGEEKQLPIASVAKVIVAVAVLKVKPIEPGTQGPTIMMTAEDVATYNQYLSEGQSTLRVQAGVGLTEYQALQALLLPSANNIADKLAVWAFGSIENYLTFVMPFTRTLGMQNTTIADASGFSPKTTSTAVDLTKLAEIAMNQPVIAEIAEQPQADLPGAGIVYNVNALLGRNGIVGIKTGNTDEAGGCYMFAAKRKIDQAHEIVVVGTIMGASDLGTSLRDSLPLIDEAFKNFEVINPIHARDNVGTISQAGGASVPVIVRQGMAVVNWKALPLKAEVIMKKPGTSIRDGDETGSVKLHVGNQTYDLPTMSSGSIESRSVFWRLRHAGGRI